MNIFDFENRVKTAANNVQHDLDMDRLLSDLNLQTKPSRFRILLPYFGFTGILLVSALAYFAYTSLQTIESSTLERIEVIETVNQKEPSILTEASGQNQATLNVEKKTKGISNLVEKNNSTVTKTQRKKKVSNLNNSPSSSTINNEKPSRLIQQGTNVIVRDEIANQNYNSKTPNLQTNKTLIENNNETIIQNNSTDIKLSESTIKLEKLPLLSTYMKEGTPKNLHKKVAECPKFTDGNWNFAIVPEVGGLLPIKSLSLKDSGFNTIFQDRDRNESSQVSFSTGISVQFRNKITGLYIRPGFSYNRIEETFTNEDTRFSTNQNKYQIHQYNIPVAIGTSLDQDKFSINLEGGLIFNFLQETNGLLFNGGEDFIMLDNEQTLFKESVGLGFFAGASINTKLNANTELFIGPRFILNTLSTSSNQNPIDQRYSFVGLNAGIVYTLF